MRDNPAFDENEYRRKVYKPNFEAGSRYEDFVVEELKKRGVFMEIYDTKASQLNGENSLGMEIKLDREYERFGNLYIEIDEKSSPEKEEFTPSGIFRNDNTWLWASGDYTYLHIFFKSFLKDYYQTRQRMLNIKENKYHTGHGYLLRVAPVIDYCHTICFKELEDGEKRARNYHTG